MGITDGIKNILSSRKSLDELEEEEERAEVQLSIAQKKAAIKQLQNKGGVLSDFKEKGRGISWSGVINWLKTH